MTYVGNEKATERDDVSLVLRRLEGERTPVASGADEGPRGPDVPQEVVFLISTRKTVSTENGTP